MRYKFKVPLFEKYVFVYYKEYIPAVKKATQINGGVSPFTGGEDESSSWVGGGVMYLNKFDVNTIAHECSHLTDNLVWSLGIKDDETKAYIMGFLFEKIYNKFKE